MNLTVVKHDTPKLNIPEILCDRPLHKKLNKIPLLSLMNKSFCAAVLGRPGSGKSSLVHGFLSTKSMFFQVFDTICLFMPPNSRKSFKESIYEGLGEDQVFDTLNSANLQKAWEKAQSNAKQKTPKNTLLIFDDVQQHFKGEAQQLLLNIQSNRRHNYTSIIFVCQSYKKLPRPNRLGLTDMFGYNLTKDDLEDVFNELVDKPRASWDLFVRYYRNLVESQSHNRDEHKNKTTKGDDERLFIYFNTDANRHFINWNEVIVIDPKDDMSGMSLMPAKQKKRKFANSESVGADETSEPKPKKQK